MHNVTIDIINQAKLGDKMALTKIIEQTSPAIYRFSLNMLRSHEEASDVTQETYLKMLKHIMSYDAEYAFNTWLYRIARNCCIDKMRHKMRWKEKLLSSFEFEEKENPVELIAGNDIEHLDLLIQEERDVELDKYLKLLKPTYREVLVLFHFEDLGYQEISNVLNIPIGTVMNRIFRARQKLKELLTGVAFA